MVKLKLPRQKLDALLKLLENGSRFEVVEKLIGTELPMAFVLMSSKPSWGHFCTAAFCAVTDTGEGQIELRVSHLNIQRAWHGTNIFRATDRKIEDEICAFVTRTISEAKREQAA